MIRVGMVFWFFLKTIVVSDTLSSGGALSKNQSLMDVIHYSLDITVDPYREIIKGVVEITFRLFNNPEYLEIDLLDTYDISGIFVGGMSLGFKRIKHKIYINNPGLDLSKNHILEIRYGGKPPVAKRPPWDGGFTWETGEDGRPWVGVSCQANGAYIWYPCKEHPSDKPDSANIIITAPDPLMAVSNGVLYSKNKNGNKWTTWHWKTKYPISTYNINFTIGAFREIKKVGYILDEPVNIVYYFLPEVEDGSTELLNSAEKYLNFYAKTFCQYPWAEEKFGLVHTPYWGMEHQTINAYGNNYKKTKLGYDFILFHEMGHEWWGNFLSVADWSDFWIHEGFDTYAEAIFIEEEYGWDAAQNFVKTRFKKNIKNEYPIVPDKNSTTNQKSGNDVYYKAAYVLHTLRYLIGDEIFKASIKEFLVMPKELPGNQTSTKEFISLINENTSLDLGWFFNQYLYKNELPVLNINENIIKDKKYIDIWWENHGFIMPLEISYETLGGYRKRKIDLNNSQKRIAMSTTSKLEIDPEGWVLLQKNYIGK